MTTHPIGYYFQNVFNSRLDLLNQMDYGDLADLQVVIFRASAEARVEGCDELNLREAAENLESFSFSVHDGIRKALSVLEGFPSVDALNLVRAIVDIMETAKVN